MSNTRFAIVGGGLSGLYAAFLLEQHGVSDYVLLEARDSFGGRIASASSGELPTHGRRDATGESDRFDLGPTWFWPELQPQLDRLVGELGLARFVQHEIGDLLIERAHGVPPSRTPGFVSSPTSMRLVGGMEALVDALRRELDSARLVVGRRVTRLRCEARHVELDTADARGATMTYRAERVLLAVPPRLAANRVDFTPALPDPLMRAWRETATWMAPHAKYLAVYDAPFWREQGLSGGARSAIGPMVEIHDASTPNGIGALFGFLGVSARARSTVPDGVLRAHCRTQLGRLFGARAVAPVAEFLKDWARDPCTAVDADLDGATEHGSPPSSAAAEGVWRDRLIGIASEWSPRYPGYVAGAIEAAGLGVGAVLNRAALPGGFLP